MKKVLTLCLIYNNGKILLGMKKRGFGQGKWNGFGGKVKEGEIIEEAAKREVLEESGMNILKMVKAGKIDFEFQGNPETLEVNIFACQKFSGEPAESDEMKPQWFNIKEIPFDKMWPDDKFWLPLLLANKKFKGKFLFSNSDKVLNYKLKKVKKFNLCKRKNVLS